MKIYTFGSNDGSQLGDAELTGTHIPHVINCKLNIEQMVCGTLHNVLLADGKVYTYGCNDDFLLGRDGEEHEILEVSLPEKVVAVSAGESHTACLTVSNKVYAWGTFRDNSGVLGFNVTNKYMKKPRMIGKDVVRIASSQHMLVMMKRTGSIMCYGPDLVRRTKRKRDISVLSTRVLERGNKKHKTNRLFAGADQVFATNGVVKAFGNNSVGQLGSAAVKEFKVLHTGGELSNVKQICTASLHSMFLTEKKDLLVSGLNQFGQLGTDAKQCVDPVKIAEKVDMIACGGNSSLFVRDNKVYTFGGNFDGECGFNEDNHVLKPTMLDYDFGEILMVGMGHCHTVIISKDK